MIRGRRPGDDPAGAAFQARPGRTACSRLVILGAAACGRRTARGSPRSRRRRHLQPSRSLIPRPRPRRHPHLVPRAPPRCLRCRYPRSRFLRCLWPEVSVPEVSVPEVSVPEVSVPEVSVPEVSVPEVSVPEVSVPEVSVPEVSVPEVSVPEVSVPEVSVPEVSVPEVSVPESRYPTWCCRWRPSTARAMTVTTGGRTTAKFVGGHRARRIPTRALPSTPATSTMWWPCTRPTSRAAGTGLQARSGSSARTPTTTWRPGPA